MQTLSLLVGVKGVWLSRAVVDRPPPNAPPFSIVFYTPLKQLIQCGHVGDCWPSGPGNLTAVYRTYRLLLPLLCLTLANGYSADAYVLDALSFIVNFGADVSRHGGSSPNLDQRHFAP